VCNREMTTAGGRCALDVRRSHLELSRCLIEPSLCKLRRGVSQSQLGMLSRCPSRERPQQRGLANSPALLVGSRAVQGLGAAFMAPAALSLLTVIFAEGEFRHYRGRLTAHIRAGNRQPVLRMHRRRLRPARCWRGPQSSRARRDQSARRRCARRGARAGPRPVRARRPFDWERWRSSPHRATWRDWPVWSSSPRQRPARPSTPMRHTDTGMRTPAANRSAMRSSAC
jgi:hypothetical protein